MALQLNSNRVRRTLTLIEMLDRDDRKLLGHYMPLISAELRRLGVSEEDERWIHAGTNQRPTKALCEANLVALRALPTGMGARAYCQWLGFDYDQAKRELAGYSAPPNGGL